MYPLVYVLDDMAECLFSAAPEVVRSYGWEPTEVFDTIASGWGNVASLAISSSQLIGVTYSQSRLESFCLNGIRSRGQD